MQIRIISCPVPIKIVIIKYNGLSNASSNSKIDIFSKQLILSHFNTIHTFYLFYAF